MSFDVVVVGPISEDLSLRIDSLPADAGSIVASETLRATGGKGANPAVAAAQLGTKVALVGIVGDDAVGVRVLEQLRGDGIDLSGVRIAAGLSTGAIVHLVEPDGHRRCIEHPGANDHLTLASDEVSRLCTSATVVVLSTALPREAVQAAAQGAATAGARLFLDVAGPAPTSHSVLPGAYLIRGDSHEIAALTDLPVRDFATAGAAARRLSELGPPVVIVEAGDDGELVLASGEELRIPRRPVEVVDPTGGGDSLIAMLAVSIGRGMSIKPAAHLASHTATRTVAHLGGRPRLASRR